MAIRTPAPGSSSLPRRLLLTILLLFAAVPGIALYLDDDVSLLGLVGVVAACDVIPVFVLRPIRDGSSR